MKKTLLLSILGIFCLSLIGCSNSPARTNQTQVNQTESNQSQNSQTQSSQTQNRNKISLEQAREIALKHANLKENQVNFIKESLEVDDGVDVYNIEFSFENKEYDYEINAITGEIIEFDEDIENYDINTNNYKVTQSQAQEIALKDANLKAEQVFFDKIEIDFKNNTPVYEIEFKYNNKEYDYKIDANTGEIISKSQDNY